MVLIDRGLDGFSHYAVFRDRGSALFLQPNTLSFRKGDDGGGDTPLPIPNRVVKPASADGTAGETLWESRSSPIFYDSEFSLTAACNDVEPSSRGLQQAAPGVSHCLFCKSSSQHLCTLDG